MLELSIHNAEKSLFWINFDQLFERLSLFWLWNYFATDCYVVSLLLRAIVQLCLLCMYSLQHWNLFQYLNLYYLSMF